MLPLFLIAEKVMGMMSTEKKTVGFMQGPTHYAVHRQEKKQRVQQFAGNRPKSNPFFLIIEHIGIPFAILRNVY
jgi:hypothetical protein